MPGWSHFEEFDFRCELGTNTRIAHTRPVDEAPALSAGAAIVPAVTTNTSHDGIDIEAMAERLRRNMVDELRAQSWIRSERVAAAMLAVPRHRFAPGVPPETVYGAEDVVRIKHDANGRCISSISAPRAQAEMLEMSGIRDGDAVLEIGSGGVNAAMLAQLVGPRGRVVTVDIDEEVTDRASRCLDETGYSHVTVVLGDAEYGVPDFAPYDRILVTAGAWVL
jgi:protein-L-isoaspartate(D-aspartate) O-methyltransferase